MRHLVIVQVLSGVDMFLNILSMVLVIYALMTWILKPDNPIYMLFSRVSNMVMTPFRPIGEWLLRKGLRVDLTLFITLAAIQLLRNILTQLTYSVLFY